MNAVRVGFLICSAVLAGAPAAAQGRVIDVRGAAPPSVAGFEALWVSYARAERAGDVDNARRVFQEIRRVRVERNVESLDALGMALVAQGVARLGAGERERAEEIFRSAIGIAPRLADAHLGLASTQLKKGPLGVVPGARTALTGVLAGFGRLRGHQRLTTLGIPVVLVALFFCLVGVALALVVRHGDLLKHDLEETLGPARHPSVALAFFVVLMLLPSATFQGWGWLPLWWLALLFVYLSLAEKAVVVLLLMASVAVGPLLGLLDSRLQAARNPLFWAAAAIVEASPDPWPLRRLEAARAAHPADHDLSYLLAAHYRKAGRSDEAAALYRALLEVDENDPIAKNNLANLEFARGEFQSAIERYRQGIEVGGQPEMVATFYYNQSLAHLQRFEYQPAQEAKSNADRLARGLVASYEQLWRYDKGDYAVVDLGLSPAGVLAKFLGVADGPGVANVARGSPAAAPELGAWLGNRFTGVVAVFGLGVLGVSLWRGRRTFTQHCLKCGTAFCRQCHLGAVVAGLCSQCYHLFVVRDGVSGPARNRKLLEVQAHESRRSRTFRVLSLVFPGAGHLYARRTLLGLALVLGWCGVIATALLCARLMPFADAPVGLRPPGAAWLAAAALVAIWLAANRLRPDFDVAVPVRRGARRPRTAGG